jgi:hypothetical protein
MTFSRRLTIAAGALLFAASPTARSEVPIVHVTFSYASIQHGLFHTPAEEKEHVATVTAKLVKLLNEQIKFWPFTVDAGSPVEPLLNVSLKLDGDRCDAVLALQSRSDAPAMLIAEFTVYKSGVHPNIFEVETYVLAALTKYLSGNRAQEIVLPKFAQTLALGTTIQILRAGAHEPVGVLPLEWTRYCALVGSDFRIETRQQDHAVWLDSRAMTQPADWPGPPGYQALKVIHKTMTSEMTPDKQMAVKLAALAGLTPVRFRVQNLIVDLTYCPDPQRPGPQPALAPP